MVRIDIGLLRLVTEASGRYSVHEMKTRETGKRKGERYVRHRYSGLTLSQAIGKLIELWPHREDAQLESLADLHRDISRARHRIEQLLAESRPERCPRCQSFKKWYAECKRCSYQAQQNGDLLP